MEGLIVNAELRARTAGRRSTWARLGPALLAALACATLGAGAAVRADEPTGETVTDVRIERVRPKHEKRPTLTFLKENRDFIRQRFDRLREKPVERRLNAEAIDPRFLTYRDLLARIGGGADSLRVAEEARGRRDLFQSITQLGDLEAQLDLMERLLAEQRSRLGVLQANFTGDQRTALVVVLSGAPASVAPSAIALTLEGGPPLTVPLTDEQRQSLSRGGVVQVFHGFVEPREQVVELALAGDRWPTGGPGYLTLEPARDRLSFLRLDLSGATAEQGAPSLHASTWLHDAGTP